MSGFRFKVRIAITFSRRITEVVHKRAEICYTRTTYTHVISQTYVLDHTDVILYACIRHQIAIVQTEILFWILRKHDILPGMLISCARLHAYRTEHSIILDIKGTYVVVEIIVLSAFGYIRHETALVRGIMARRKFRSGIKNMARRRAERSREISLSRMA